MSDKQKIIDLENRIHRLNEIGMALSTESDSNKLFEMILEEARNITNADGRTLYSKNEKGDLQFEILRNDTMNTTMGGSSGIKIPFDPVKLWVDESTPNQSNVSAYVALTGEIVNIKDAYKEAGFDFSGTKAYDQKTGYRSQSFLTVPLKNHENEIIGVMQLINARNKNGKVVSFDSDMQEQIESLASQGAVALTNKKLVGELKTLFEAFIQLIATAIDKKSEYTGGHCSRVPIITMMLADEVAKTKTGKYKDFKMTEDDRYELYIAAWLHDCGKVATPPHVVDKGTKLETIFDRIELIKTRMEILKRDAEIDFLNGQMGISLFDAKPRTLPYKLDMMERHPLGSQAFIPMNCSAFLVTVAQDENNVPAKPKAFLSRPGQAINFHRNTWHGVLTPLDDPGIFAVIDRIGSEKNLEEWFFEKTYLVTHKITEQ